MHRPATDDVKASNKHEVFSHQHGFPPSTPIQWGIVSPALSSFVNKTPLECGGMMGGLILANPLRKDLDQGCAKTDFPSIEKWKVHLAMRLTLMEKSVRNFSFRLARYQIRREDKLWGVSLQTSYPCKLSMQTTKLNKEKHFLVLHN